MEPVSLTNSQISELCALESYRQEDRKAKALRRASRVALEWPVEAAAMVADGRSLTELPSVGPYTAGLINGWLDDPPEVPDPPPLRAGFITLAAARAAMATDPGRVALADLQMHTVASDGNATLAEMVDACSRYEFIAITDHSKELSIANGMDEERLAAQGSAIDALNEARTQPPRVLKAIEMNLDPAGRGDMDPTALARLDLVLGAFHSKLRLKDDQTARYQAAIRNPTVDVLAHPRCRMFNFRLGLSADWDVVVETAAEEGMVLEVDCHPNRQDLNVELLRVAREYDVTFSIGTDAHSTDELAFIDIGIGATILSGIPPERVLNLRPWNGAPRRR
jgi:histidinol phosphatase-like PHP family hydrolase